MVERGWTYSSLRRHDKYERVMTIPCEQIEIEQPLRRTFTFRAEGSITLGSLVAIVDDDQTVRQATRADALIIGQRRSFRIHLA